MQTRLTQLARRLWLPALVLLLAACGASQATPLAASATPVAATPAAPTITTSAVTSTSAPTVAATMAATLAPAVTANVQPLASSVPPPTATATPDPAVTAVLAYLEARARADATALTGLSCKTWKVKAVTEAASFRSMNAKLVGVTCQVTGTAGSFTLVGCGGKMVTTYGAETRDWDLSPFTYQMTVEDGLWKMCGYH